MKRNVKLTVFNKVIQQLTGANDMSAYKLAFCLITNKEELLAEFISGETKGCPPNVFTILLHPILINLIKKRVGAGLVSDYLENVLKQAQNEHLE